MIPTVSETISKRRYHYLLLMSSDVVENVKMVEYLISQGAHVNGGLGKRPLRLAINRLVLPGRAGSSTGATAGTSTKESPIVKIIQTLYLAGAVLDGWQGNPLSRYHKLHKIFLCVFVNWNILHTKCIVVYRMFKVLGDFANSLVSDFPSPLCISWKIQYLFYRIDTGTNSVVYLEHSLESPHPSYLAELVPGHWWPIV